MESQSLREVWETAWQQLSRAVHDKRHPFRTPVFCSSTAQGQPHARSLVLRKVVEQQQLWCYTDQRSRKVAEIGQNAQVQWHFWHPRQQLQLLLWGRARFLPAEEAVAIFQTMPKHSRKTYATLAAPGTLQKEPTDGLPAHWPTAELADTDYAAANFQVIVTEVVEADLLLLRREGHLRLRAERSTVGNWQFSWIVP